MNDGGSTGATATQSMNCDVCIVGAGLTGLNALFAASRYLSRGNRIILIDQREQVGGMWVDAYRYLRLQQPHGMFTAGNIKWTLRRERSYLATREEVVTHFGHCVDEVRKKVPVDLLLGWTVQDAKEYDDHVELTCADSHGRDLSISAKRLIKATGLHIRPNEPLAVSSKRIRSVSPDWCTMREGEIGSSDTPVWVIGGGKTAMDTAHELITAYPGREVNMVAGSGTFFASRDQCFPIGLRRWWTGTLVSTIAAEVSRRFDGTNEGEVSGWLRAACGTWITARTGNFQQGILSAAETSTIADGLNEVVMDHFSDVVDDGASASLVLRSGATISVTPDSWLVNCTGYLLRGEQPYEPYLSRGGRVLSIQQRSATMHLPSYAAYFLTHLMFLNKLKDLELYEFDIQDLHRKSKAALPYAMFTMAQYNLSLMSDALPTKVLLDCGLDLDRWYPLTRRALAAARFAITHRRQRPHQRRTLQTVRERFDVRCGPLDYSRSDFDETVTPA